MSPPYGLAAARSAFTWYHCGSYRRANASISAASTSTVPRSKLRPGVRSSKNRSGTPPVPERIVGSVMAGSVPDYGGSVDPGGALGRRLASLHLGRQLGGELPELLVGRQLQLRVD